MLLEIFATVALFSSHFGDPTPFVEEAIRAGEAEVVEEARPFDVEWVNQVDYLGKWNGSTIKLATTVKSRWRRGEPEDLAYSYQVFWHEVGHAYDHNHPLTDAEREQIMDWWGYDNWYAGSYGDQASEAFARAFVVMFGPELAADHMRPYLDTWNISRLDDVKELVKPESEQESESPEEETEETDLPEDPDPEPEPEPEPEEPPEDEEPVPNSERCKGGRTALLSADHHSYDPNECVDLRDLAPAHCMHGFVGTAEEGTARSRQCKD